MPEIIQLMFSQPFMVRALIVGCLVSLCAAVVGVSLVLKRYSMIGDGLSHVGFGIMTIAMVLGFSPLFVSIPVLILAAFLLLRLSSNAKVKGDSAIAIVSSSSLAIGVIAVSLSTGMNTDVSSFLFGSVLAMSASDVYISMGVAIVVLILYVIFYNRIFSITFDEDFSKATGIRVGFYNLLLAFLTALIIVVGMRMMGAMLISSLIIFPALTSMQVFGSFRSVILSSVILSVLCFVSGLVISFIWPVPTGATVVCIHLFLFLCFSLLAFIKRRW